jgi:hypothetical protein
MVSSGMLRRVALVRTDVSEELARATRRNIPEDIILQVPCMVALHLRCYVMFCQRNRLYNVQLDYGLICSLLSLKTFTQMLRLYFLSHLTTLSQVLRLNYVQRTYDRSSWSILSTLSQLELITYEF